jgi:hypothetical protein
MRITYTQHGDYLLPDITLSDLPDAPPLGRYGMMRKSFLREHHPILYNKLLLTEKLFPHLRDVDESAQTRLDAISDREIAHEIILAELVFS